MIRKVLEAVTTAFVWLIEAGSARVEDIYGHDGVERG